MTEPGINKYASFERLYQHHTVASLAHRVDFDPSMLTGRKSFRAPTSSRRSNSISTSRPTAPSIISPPRNKRTNHGPSSAPSKISNGKKLPTPAKKVPEKKSVAPASLSRQLSSSKKSNSSNNKSGGSGLSSSPSNNTTARKPAQKSLGSSDKNKVDPKFGTLTVDVANTDVKDTDDLVRPPEKDADDDILDGLLDASDNPVGENDTAYLISKGANHADDSEIDPGVDLAAQEAAMTQALDKAMEDFTAAGASSLSIPLEETNGDILLQETNNGRKEGESLDDESAAKDADTKNETVGSPAKSSHNGSNDPSTPSGDSIMERSSLHAINNFTTSTDFDSAIQATEQMARALQAKAAATATP